MQPEVAGKVRNAHSLPAGVEPHYFPHFRAFDAIEVLQRGEMREFHAALAANEEEGKEGMALDRVELVVIEVRRIDLPEKLLPADRRLSSRKLSFLLALQDVSQRLLNVLVVLPSFDGVRVGTGQRCIEGILSRQGVAFFAPLSIRQVFAELKLLEPSLEHNDAL